MRRAALLLAVAASGTVALPCRAAPATPEQFAFGLELGDGAAGPLQAFTLPETVLATLVDPELADLCMFDAQRRQVAHAITRPREADGEVAEIAVPHFPLETREHGATGGIEVSVERDDRGAIKRAFSRPTTATNTRLTGYLLERSEGEPPIEALTLSLASERAFTVTVEVEASEDLATFRPLTTAALARLEHDGRTLRRNVIALPPTRAHYLRLTFRDAPDELALTAVSARVTRPVPARARRVLELAPKSRPAGEEQLFVYELRGAFRPDRYSLVLPASTMLVEAELEAGPGADGPFHELDRALFRRAANTERELPVTRDTFFRLRVAKKGGGMHEGAPTLRLGYLAPRLLFSAATAGPYLLAYGSARARCEQFEEAALTSLSRGVPPSEDTVRTLRARLTPEPPRDLRVYVLWAVLLAAVAVLAWIARRLLRQL